MGNELRSQVKDNLVLSAHPENPKRMSEQGLAAQEVCQNSSSKFVTCHRYTGNSVKSSSPAHWHKEVEIMHFMEGTGFSHTCQCKGESFDAPAIVIVPSNLIHRTCYAPNCKVTRVLFKGDSLRLHEADKALESCLKQLRGADARGSMIIRGTDPGFSELVHALSLIEDLSDKDAPQTFDPSKAQEDSIKQDKVDAYVAATFANFGSKAELLENAPDSLLAELGLTRTRKPGRRALLDTPVDLLDDGSSKAINAGSIAIALAQNFAPSIAAAKAKQAEILQAAEFLGLKSKHTPEDDNRLLGLGLQFKAFLINFLGLMTQYGYFSEARAGRKPRATRYNDEKIKDLLKHIHDHYNSPMNITELANMLQVTNQYFCRYFKQLTDMSFIDYLNDLRLQRAAQEIATTQQSIREISMKHGFDTIGYFFKLFRERYNTTPIGYRNRFLSNKEAAEKQEGDVSTNEHEPQGSGEVIQ